MSDATHGQRRRDVTGPPGRPLRVLIIPRFGRVNPYITLLSTALTEAGVTVELATWNRATSLWRALRRTGRPDVVHLQWQHGFFVSPSGRRWPSIVRTLLFFAQWLTVRLGGTRFVWTVHNIVNHEKTLVGWEMRANRILARCVDEIIVHCEEVRSEVAAAYRIDPGMLRIVEHGHYTSWYPSPADRRDARRDLGLPSDARVFLFFGLIRPYKGVEGLIGAFRNVRGPSLRLVVVGRPRTAGLGAAIRELARRDPRVTTHLEYVDDEALMTYLGACDAVVLPYTDSLTSGAAILAASSSRAVVLPALGCAKSFPNTAAISYDPTVAHGLRTALEGAAIAPLEEMGNAAREHVEAHTWEGAAQKLLLVYAGSSDVQLERPCGGGANGP